MAVDTPSVAGYLFAVQPDQWRCLPCNLCNVHSYTNRVLLNALRASEQVPQMSARSGFAHLAQSLCRSLDGCSQQRLNREQLLLMLLLCISVTRVQPHHWACSS